MKTLHRDVSRCAARFAFTDEFDEWCPERHTCQRYLAFTKWDKEAGILDYRWIAITMGMRDCKIKIKTIEVVE